jgi:hypothetical protein
MNNKKSFTEGLSGEKNFVKTMNNHVAAYNPTGEKNTGEIGKGRDRSDGIPAKSESYEDVFVNAVENRRWGLSHLPPPPASPQSPRVHTPSQGRKRRTTGMRRSGERAMKQMRAVTGAKVWVIASGGDSHSESRQGLTFSKAIAPLHADEKSNAPLFAGEC